MRNCRLRAFYRPFSTIKQKNKTDIRLISVLEIRVGRTNKGEISISSDENLMILDVPPTLIVKSIVFRR